MDLMLAMKNYKSFCRDDIRKETNLSFPTVDRVLRDAKAEKAVWILMEGKTGSSGWPTFYVRPGAWNSGDTKNIMASDVLAEWRKKKGAA